MNWDLNCHFARFLHSLQKLLINITTLHLATLRPGKSRHLNIRVVFSVVESSFITLLDFVHFLVKFQGVSLLW